MQSIFATWDKIIRHLDNDEHVFLADVLSLGFPVVAEKTDSDGVESVRLIDGKLRVAINPKTFKQKTLDEQTFTIVHELCHILFGDYSRRNRFDEPKRYDIAADCVVNDYLFGSGFDIPDEHFRGMDVVGRDCTLEFAQELYDEIILPPQDESGEGEGEGEGQQGASGIWGDNDSFFDDVSSLIRQNEEEIQLAEGEDRRGPKTHGRSGNEDGIPDLVDSVFAAAVTWDDLISELKFKYRHDKGRSEAKLGKLEASFRRPDRKAAHLYPKFFMPSMTVANHGRTEMIDHRPQVFIAVDGSGSIGDRLLKKFLSYIEAIDTKKINPTIYTFSTTMVPYYLGAKNNRLARGGTDFGAIEAVCRRLPKYPEAVLVITDGEDQPPRVPKEYRDRWIFALFEYWTEHLVKSANRGESMTQTLLNSVQEGKGSWSYEKSLHQAGFRILDGNEFIKPLGKKATKYEFSMAAD